MLSRLSRMTAAEVGHRVWQQAVAHVERAGLGRARPPPPCCRDAGHRWVESLSITFDTREYAVAAESVLRGRFCLLGIDDMLLGFPPVWNRDPKTGTLCPMRFGKTLDYRDPSVVGEVRYIWELNRHLELVTLAQAWHLTGEQRYATACRLLLQSWFEQCPYPRGPNWISSLELGIRLVNWSFAWHLLGGEASCLFHGADGRAFRAEWLASVYQHCHFISGHPSLHSSANNHLIGEQVGLFVAATTWPFWAACGRWQVSAQHVLERETLLQNAPDGVNREQAVWYQHEVTDMLLVAGLVGRANGRDFSADYWSRIESMLEFVASIMDVGGNVPALGDADDAVVVGLRPNKQTSVYKSLLATGAVLFNRGDFKFKAGQFDAKSRWLLGDVAARAFDAIETEGTQVPPRRLFPHGGYYVLGSDFESADEVRIVADAGPLGYLAIAAHGHADALSFTLSVAGHEILIDPGTYVYQGAPRWRDYFRGTSAHNTIRVDGHDQSVSGGTFLWVEHAETICEAVSLTGPTQRLAARHLGYRRFRSSVTHRRVLEYSQDVRTLLVDDHVLGVGSHEIELHWHVSDRCAVRLYDTHALIQCDETVVSLSWPECSVVELVRGREEPPLGWQSPRFDKKHPCTTIVVRVRSTGDWHGTSEIQVLWTGTTFHQKAACVVDDPATACFCKQS